MNGKHFGTVACTALLKTLLLGFNLIFFVRNFKKIIFKNRFNHYLFFYFKGTWFRISSDRNLWYSFQIVLLLNKETILTAPPKSWKDHPKLNTPN